MSKLTLLSERVMVARRTRDVAELQRIKEEIRTSFESSGRTLSEAARTLNVAPMTLGRIVSSLGMDEELGILDAKSKHVLLLSRARIAIEEGDAKTAYEIGQQVLDAIEKAGGNLKRGGAIAAKELGISYWALKKLINTLDMGEEIKKRFPGKGKTRPLTVRVNGKKVTHTVGAWARILGINRTTILERLKRGCTPEEAIRKGDLREK